MKPIMLVSPRTYTELQANFAYFFEREGKKYPIRLEVEAAAQDWVGYLLVDGQYLGAFDLSPKDGGDDDDGALERKPDSRKNYGTA
jgi:hypothetical protein